MRFTSVAAATVMGLMATAVTADEFSPAMRSYFETNIAGWLSDPMVVEAIKMQNAKTAQYSQGEIDLLDLDWRAQVGQSDSDLIEPVLSGAAAEFLREQVAASGGVITEVFTMDARGLNVAASGLTSDYWQGDEAKFTETFGKGAGSMHVGDVEFDESSQSYSGQVSVVVVDPGTGAPIGAVTVGLNAEAFM